MTSYIEHVIFTDFAIPVLIHEFSISIALYPINFFAKKFQIKNISIKKYSDIYVGSTNANEMAFLRQINFSKNDMRMTLI